MLLKFCFFPRLGLLLLCTLMSTTSLASFTCVDILTPLTATNHHSVPISSSQAQVVRHMIDLSQEDNPNTFLISPTNTRVEDTYIRLLVVHSHPYKARALLGQGVRSTDFPGSSSFKLHLLVTRNHRNVHEYRSRLDALETEVNDSFAVLDTSTTPLARLRTQLLSRAEHSRSALSLILSESDFQALYTDELVGPLLQRYAGQVLLDGVHRLSQPALRELQNLRQANEDVVVHMATPTPFSPSERVNLSPLAQASTVLWNYLPALAGTEPPGTLRTGSVVEQIRQAIQQKEWAKFSNIFYAGEALFRRLNPEKAHHSMYVRLGKDNAEVLNPEHHETLAIAMGLMVVDHQKGVLAVANKAEAAALSQSLNKAFGVDESAPWFEVFHSDLTLAQQLETIQRYNQASGRRWLVVVKSQDNGLAIEGATAYVDVNRNLDITSMFHRTGLVAGAQPIQDSVSVMLFGNYVNEEIAQQLISELQQIRRVTVEDPQRSEDPQDTGVTVVNTPLEIPLPETSTVTLERINEARALVDTHNFWTNAPEDSLPASPPLVEPVQTPLSPATRSLTPYESLSDDDKRTFITGLAAAIWIEAFDQKKSYEEVVLGDPRSEESPATVRDSTSLPLIERLNRGNVLLTDNIDFSGLGHEDFFSVLGINAEAFTVDAPDNTPTLEPSARLALSVLFGGFTKYFEDAMSRRPDRVKLDSPRARTYYHGTYLQQVDHGKIVHEGNRHAFNALFGSHIEIPTRTFRILLWQRVLKTVRLSDIRFIDNNTNRNSPFLLFYFAHHLPSPLSGPAMNDLMASDPNAFLAAQGSFLFDINTTTFRQAYRDIRRTRMPFLPERPLEIQENTTAEWASVFGYQWDIAHSRYTMRASERVVITD